MDLIYLDHSATTPLDSRVLDAILPYFSEQFGNSLAVHRWGRDAERAVEDARTTVARWLNCQPHEVIFTSGGTESDNLALRGPAQFARAHDRPFTLITSPLEHKAVSLTARQLHEVLGASLRIVGVDHYGRVEPDDLRAALQTLPPNGVTLVSLMTVHNEIGTLYPVAEYAAIAHAHGAIFHTDAVQAAGHFPLDVAASGVDMLSLSSHKFYGPKGMGVFFLRDGIDFYTSHTGAKHEDHRRAGTHNTPGIVGTAAALDFASTELKTNSARLSALRDRLIAAILDRVPDCALTGDPMARHPGLASFVFKNLDANTLLMHLDQHGIAASSGSACKTGSPQPSAVLEALGCGPEWTRGGLRLSLGHSTTAAQIDAVIDILPDAVAKVRKLAALSFS